MPTIEIFESDFTRLQRIAVPLVDTPATVFTRLLDFYESIDKETQPTPKSPPATSTFDAKSIPPMVHTKLLSASLGGVEPEKAAWDALVRLALIKVFEANNKNAAELRRLSGANVASGRKETDGYKFVASHGFSYQGVSAEDAIDIIARCAKTLGQCVDMEFEWRNKEGAFKPGERATIRIEA